MSDARDLARRRPRMRPRIKICGVTREEDARAAVELGADLLGLNFHPPSPRHLSVDAARALARAAAGRALLAGVFVNRPAAEIEEIAAAVGLDLVQLSGDEGPAEVAAFGRRAIKGLRVDPAAGLPAAAELAADYPGVWGFLFDVRHDTLYGGTGETWDYRALAALDPDRLPGTVLVAGGIRPGNAARALAASGAGGVDLCSGVESSPGIKDRHLLERLFRELRPPHPSTTMETHHGQGSSHP